MKELSIEEKAKAYDEAKARMSKACNSNRCTIGFMNEIFPELKESEDERVRKKLIDLIYKVYANTSYITCVEHEDMLAWLEKQCEKTSWKPTEEQMDALETAVSSLQSNTLERLYQDLKREKNYE